MIIVIDGNDGTGKSRLAETLRELGYEVKDRGLPTVLTDHPERIGEVAEDEVYIILVAPVEVSQERLLAAGRDITEKYHTIPDLTYYKRRFEEVAAMLPRCVLVNADQAPEMVLFDARVAITAHAALMRHAAAQSEKQNGQQLTGGP